MLAWLETLFLSLFFLTGPASVPSQEIGKTIEVSIQGKEQVPKADHQSFPRSIEEDDFEEPTDEMGPVGEPFG